MHSLLRRYERLRSYRSEIRTTPTIKKHDDLFVVAYPKSGVTWFSFLLANLALGLSEDKRKATFFNLQVFVPDIHVSNNLNSTILPQPGFRIIKSHSVYNRNYKNIFYLVRDPRKIMVSYYFFLQTLGMYSGSLHGLIHDRKLGITVWVRHTLSWLEKTPPSTMMQFFHYEDLIDDTATVIERVLILWGYEPDEVLIADAVAKSCFENMKKDEKLYNSGNLTIPDQFEFVRKGGAKQREEIDQKDLEYINDKAGELMRKLGYE